MTGPGWFEMVRTAAAAVAVGAGVTDLMSRVPGTTVVAGAQAVAVTAAILVLLVQTLDMSVREADTTPFGPASWTGVTVAGGLVVWVLAGGPGWLVLPAAAVVVFCGLSGVDDDGHRARMAGVIALGSVCLGQVLPQTGAPGAVAGQALLGGVGLACVAYGFVSLRLTPSAYDGFSLHLVGAGLGVAVTGLGVGIALVGAVWPGTAVVVGGTAVSIGTLAAAAERWVVIGVCTTLAGIAWAASGLQMIVNGPTGIGVAFAVVGAVLLGGVGLYAASRDAFANVVAVVVLGVLVLGAGTLLVAGVWGIWSAFVP